MSIPVVKLVKGVRTLDLNDQSKYFLGADFVPPSVALEPSFAQGSSSNRRDGASLISSRAANRGWSFSINIVTTGSQEMERAIRNIQFMLGLAGDSDEPLYLKYRANSDIAFEPLWGQDGWLFYQIEHGIVGLGGEYGYINRRATNLYVTLNLVIRPYSIGLRQRLASATGGILEDRIGVADGISRGLIVPESITNKMTNPIFGHVTWNNGWTADANIAASQNTKKDFVLFGDNSAQVLSRGSTSNVFYQSINAGSTGAHVLSCYVKRLDGAAVTSSDCDLWYSTAQTTAFTSVGNGWYRLSASVTGIASSTATGIRIKSGRTVYVDGFQLEGLNFITPLVHGDLLSCAWTGTAHASTSARTTARVRVPTADSMNAGHGTIRVIWRPSRASAGIWASSLAFLFDSRTGASASVYAYYDRTNSYFTLSDGTNSVNSSLQSWSINDTIVLHFVYGPDGLAMYRDGLIIGSGTSFTPPTLAANVYIGSANDSSVQADGTFMDFTVFDRALSSAEVAGNYASIVASSQRVGSIPWLWSSDGDDDVVNHDDTDANDDNYVVCGGIPGSAPAVTFISGITDPTMYMWMMDTDEFLNPIELVNEQSGSADANSSGGAYRGTSIITSATTFTSAASSTRKCIAALAGKELANLIRLYDAGSSLQVATILSAPTPIISDYKSLTTSAAFRLYLSPFVAVQDSPPGFSDYSVSPAGFTPGIALKRSTGTGSIQIDYAMAVPRPFLTMAAASTLGEAGFYYQGRRASTYDDTATGCPYQYPLTLQGDIIEFVPDKLNILSTLIGDATHNPVIATGLTYARVIVTPRWSIL